MPYLSGSKPFVSNYSSIEYTITCLYRVHPWLHVCLCYAINGQVVYTCSEIVYKMVYSCLKGNDLKSKCINDNKSLNSILLFSKIDLQIVILVVVDTLYIHPAKYLIFCPFQRF